MRFTGISGILYRNKWYTLPELMVHFNGIVVQYGMEYPDKSGFASHSRFTINFKKYTGVLPSEYISELKQKKTMEGCNI